MADAAVEFLLNNLKETVVHHSHLIRDNKEKIESLEKDLRLFNAIHKDSLKLRNDEVTKVLVRNIRDAAYELDDVIDAYVTLAAERSQGSSFRKFWKPALSDLYNIGQKIEAVKEKVKGAKLDFAALRVDNQDLQQTAKTEIRHPRLDKVVVGFTEETKKLIGQLTEKTDSFEVVSLVGMFGAGKTTLAWKIFNDQAVVDNFDVRIWLYISLEFSKRDILLAILKKFTPIDDDIRQLNDLEITKKVFDHLKDAKFLIVMDDVWDVADWDRLSNAIPKDNEKGRILLTSRMNEVGSYASRGKKYLTNMPFFSIKESWELLKMEGLRGDHNFPVELENIGERIVIDCHCHPLSIAIIGGILATKYSTTEPSSMIKWWEEVSKQVGTSIIDNDTAQNTRILISLSYDRLPPHLHACFLYLGMFPEGYRIPVSKLIRMWIGEGFVIRDNARTLEETGEMYVEELINRNLVAVENFRADGKVKTCRVHDTLLDFCRMQAGKGNEDFLQEITKFREIFYPPITDIYNCRRLSIHSNWSEFTSSLTVCPRVRSFVCVSKDNSSSVVIEKAANILKAFKLVRVLDVKPIKFTKISNDMYQLVHARYIALSLDSSVLPAKFSQLWNIQTLIVDTTARKLEVKVDIWKLIRLRHLKTNVPATLPQPTENSKHGKELQTLGIVSVNSCTAELLEWACNLKKLAIGGDLAFLLESGIEALRAMGKMKYLEKLKLVNDASSLSEAKLNGLPQFLSNLKSLTLVTTSLTWNFMSILGSLKNLEVLKLKEKAFMGDTWKATGGGFPRLEFLQIEEMDLTVWEASPDHFPKLRRLVLKKCEKLRAIPIELAQVASLQSLELYSCKSAAASAKEIHEAKKKTMADIDAVFKLSTS